jgi:gliding motility-associated-like protein
MRIKHCLFFLIILLSGIAKGYSQPCTTLGQTPSTAFPVCGTATFVQNTVPICGGASVPGPCPATDGLTDVNPFWYRFRCYTAGTLGFLITPNNAADDYDWQLFDITGRNPNDVYTDATLFVACNWSGFSGTTGASTAGTSLINCAGNVPLFSRMPSLILNHDYLLLVSHYTQSQSGYSLNFTGGSAGITDPVVPQILSATPNCDASQVIVRFNKKLKCSSFVLNGSDFIISPSGTIASALGYGCTSSFELDSVLLTLSTPLVPGNYTVAAANGTDGNTLLDNCDRPIPTGSNAQFTITPPVPLPMGTVTPPPCAPTTLTITFADPIKCNSIAANGSDFNITGPSAVTVSSATAVNCNANGETNTITIQLSAAILVGGSYQVKVVTGTDGNTLIGLCNRRVTDGDAAPFTIVPQAAVAMGNVTPPPCTPSSITLTFAEPVLCNSVAANGSDFIVTGPSTVTVSSATAVNCNANGETTTITLQFSAPILITGTYQVQMATGSDGNTLVGNCNRQVTVGATTPFTLAPQAPIAMGAVTPPPCTPSSITLTFAEPVLCNSVAVNGSDFIITGPSPVTVSSAAALNCNANGETTSITIQFSAPILITGTYQVQMATGSDGNTLLGNCNRQVTAGVTTPFTLAPQAPIAMGAVTPPSCTPSSITLTFADLIKCNSIAANGSDFIVTGPSAVTVNSATAVNCNANGETTTITIQFSAPILVTGTYQVQVATGTDGNTLIGQCNRQVTAGSNTSFALVPQPAIAMGAITPPPCTPLSITLTFADPLLCNSIAANGSDFIVTGPSGVTVNSATAVNCNANGETTTITIQFSTAILVSGTYQVQIATGSDGNTLIGQCNRQVAAGSNTSFTLAPQPAITMGTIPPPNCSPSSIVLNFADNILCNSIAANGSDFIITGPAPVTITSATATCNANGETNAITIQLSAPINVSGNFQVQMATGSDGNTLIGNCNRRTTVGDLAPFTIPAAAPVAMDSLVPVTCSPSSLKLIFAAPIRCLSVAANGSDFIITGPSAIAIASAAGTCDANGLTTSITIQLSSPVVVGGNYQLRLVTGSDGNTLLSDCNRPTPPSSLPFIASDTVSARFQYQIQYDCQTDVITFSHNGQHNVNQWAWTVNGTTGSTSQTFTQSFSASSQNSVQLVVTNGVCSATYSTSIVLNNKVTVAFELPESVCPEDTVTFINKSSGGIDFWQWTFGNGNTSNIQNPPAQIYPLTGIETLYSVSLTAGNNLGCQATATETLKVLSACIIAVPSAFTPNNDGKNDYLYPLNAIKAENMNFRVFNRWGQLVFYSKDWRQKWDGRINGIMQATGVYIWMLDFTHKDTKQKYSMKGTTTLIR